MAGSDKFYNVSCCKLFQVEQPVGTAESSGLNYAFKSANEHTPLGCRQKQARVAVAVFFGFDFGPASRLFCSVGAGGQSADAAGRSFLSENPDQQYAPPNVEVGHNRQKCSENHDLHNEASQRPAFLREGHN